MSLYKMNYGVQPQSPFSMDSLNTSVSTGMGINPSAPNPLMFSNGRDPNTGAAPVNWMGALGSGGVPTIPQVGALGADFSNQGGGSIWDSFLTKDGDQGWGGMAMGAASGLASAFMGMQQYGLARDTLNQHKQEYAANYDAQKRTTNAAMEDRQRARVASNSGAYQSVGDYMDRNGIK